MSRVKVKEGEPIDKAIRRFKKKCEKDGIVQDMRKKARFLKPSERRRKKALKAEKRRRTEALKATRRTSGRR
ncbi:MAG: 30S ribosomal protein S21 [Candidatus Eisenbacteria bacterium]|nr:30S ribosomal protein S21 [Candidatus Eisenbacteria bacterium]